MPDDDVTRDHPEAATEAVADRRALLTKGGVAAAVAAVAGLGVAHTARAANGDTMFVGTSHTGTNTTNLSGGSTLQVQNGSSAGSASLYGTQANGTRFGVRGDNSGSDGVAVYGNANGSGGTGVRGLSSGTSGIGVHGRATASSGRGVYGVTVSTEGRGVYGLHDSSTTPGTGVVGQSRQGTGIVGIGTSIDIVANGTGRLRLGPVGQTGGATQTGAPGTLARDTNGHLWYCFATNQWEQVTGTGGGGGGGGGGGSTDGTFVAITPARVFDSRIGAYPQSGLLAPNASKTISVANGRDGTGMVTTPNVVPANAKAVAFNITVTGTTGPNFVSVVPGDAASYTTSTINWSGAGENLANGSISKLDASRQLKLFGGDQSGSTHAIVDINGYFL